MNPRDYVDDIARSIGFLSRISVPERHFVGHDGSLSRAVCAFPLAGFLIALPAAAVFAVLLAFRAEPLMAAFVVLGVQAALTGALHEDGLADTADGIGGGRDREHALTIMRDSRIGTYGAVALVLSFGLRASALAALARWLTPTEAGFALAGIAAISRTAMVWHWSMLSPARKDGVAASVGEPDKDAAIFAYVTGGLLCLVFAGSATSFTTGLTVIVVAALATWLLTRHISSRIGGHTGDTIGASQQISEMAALFALALLV